MELRTEKESRFRIDELEARIAPGAAAFGLNNAVAAAENGIEAVNAHNSQITAQEIIDNIVAKNPQVC